jgi:hypothetical protein
MSELEQIKKAESRESKVTVLAVPRHNPVRLRNQQLRRAVGKVGLL